LNTRPRWLYAAPVSSDLPLISVIVPTRPDGPEPTALSGVRRLDYPPDRLEVIVARGRQPSVQRNTALRAARGQLVYFIDDDSIPQPGNLRRALALFQDPAVAMVGGPNLCPPEAPRLEKIFAVVLSSLLAFGPSRARYAVVGAIRPTSEKELILCNLMARREPVMALGGFDEALYPNEENALMDGLQQRGNKLLYDPAFQVHRRPRPTLRAFFKMLMTYGRGRAEQFRLHPTPGSALNFVPPLFVAYLLLVPLLAWKFPLGLWPLALYGLAVLGQTLASVPQHGLGQSLLAAPLLLASHVFYGVGFWRGLFTRLRPPGAPPATGVTLETAGPKP
jgi:succinoglycan biosynthesis protein ExoA